VGAGRVGAEAQRLLEATREALARAVAVARAGATVGDIGWAVQSWVESQGMSVIRDFVGHGIGRALHEDPAIPNWGTPGRGARLRAGMTIAVEPMVALGSPEVSVSSQDGWTVRTKDKSLAAHFEHTLLVTAEGCEILTAV
jgi:methionyl aminopeptidase